MQEILLECFTGFMGFIGFLGLDKLFCNGAAGRLFLVECRVYAVKRVLGV